MQIGVETSRAVDSKRIFVVDDDGITRAVLQFMLQDDNETHDLPSLTDAYGKGRPDLLLLGVSVVKNGPPDLLTALSRRWPGIRIVIVANAKQEDVARSFLRSGAHGVLTGPFTVESVRQKVDIQLGRVVPSLIQLQILPKVAR